MALQTNSPARYSAFPTRDKFIRLRRHPNSTIERDSFLPCDTWVYAKILISLKMDKFGRKYFNIRYADGGDAGIYLPRGGSGKDNDLIWEMTTEEAFLQAGADQVPQADGLIQTPESMTPDNSPDRQVEEERPESPAWDHSPERLAEDNVFIWEETPLVPLSAREIKSSEEEETQALNPLTPDHVPRAEDHDGDRRGSQSAPEWMLWRPSNSPNARFRRMPVIRRPRLRYPLNDREVQLGRPSNLNSVLPVDRPLLPELVNNDRRQVLGEVLDVLHGDDLQERLI